MNYDGLKTAIIEMLSGANVKVDTATFKNDTVNIHSKDDVLTYMIHLGYLGYDQYTKTAFIPNEEIRQELTYQEMYQSVENIWSLLFMTGYLTQRQRLDASHYKLAIPNLEVRDIFKTQIMEYFKEGVAKDGDTLKQLCDALKGGDAEKVERLFEGYLKKTISIRDTFVEKSLKENFYHGILLGILGVKEDWGVFSNRETGDGYSDIMIETEDSEMGIIIEIKYAGDGNLLNACEKALKQVEETNSEETLLENGVEKILKYGIACYMKHCKVMCSER